MFNLIIDVTNEVYTKLKNELVGVTVLSSYPSTKPKFPCVVIEEMLNSNYSETVDSSGDNHSDVTIEVNIFSDSHDRVSVVKGIRNSVDSILSGLYGMNRVIGQPTNNFLDQNIYRYTLRYNFIIGENRVIYRR